MDEADLRTSWAESLHREIWEASDDVLLAEASELPGRLSAAGVSLSDVLQELPDESLALAIQRGFLVKETFTALFVERYGPYLAHWTYRWGADSHRALDLIQQLYLRFYERRLASYRPTRSFRAYLHRSAYNLWVSQVCRPKKLAPLSQALEAASAEQDPKQALLDKETAEQIDQALEQLRPQERDVLRQAMADKAADEIAQALGLRKQQVFMYLFRARRRMEQLLRLPPRKRSSGPVPASPQAPEASQQ